MIIYFDNGKNPFTPLFSACGDPLIMPYNRKLKVKIIRKLEKYPFLWDFLYNKKEIVPHPNETVIVFDSNMSGTFLKWLKKRFPDNRIVFWYWNPVRATLKPDLIPEGIERWSYSKSDCKKHGLEYNTPFYFDCLTEKNDFIGSNKRQSALFVGRDKGRLDELLKWKKILETIGLDCEFYIVGSNNSSGYSYEKQIDYENVIEKVLNHSVLVDFYSDINAGLSMRAMEAICYDKKIITNNVAIKDYDFYDPQKILIMNDDYETISSFVSTPTCKYSDTVKKKYLFSSWLKRFNCF